MTRPDRLDPIAAAGSFAYLESDAPPEMSLQDWRAQQRDASGGSSRSGAGGADAGHAPGSQPAGADGDGSAAQRAGPRLEEAHVNSVHSTELVAGPLAGRRERREALRRLGRQGRLAAYRRGEFDLDSCCLWAAAYPHEVPLLNGEFEFIARTTPEVCER